MGSTEASERSLSSGLLPQWMKNKITDARLDLDESAAFSPPTLDDSFFYIRYPREDVSSVEIKDRDVGYRPITQILKEEHKSNLFGRPRSSQNIDYSKHTPPCQQFIPNAVRKDFQTTKSKTSTPIKIKSNGTDDGFKGEGAACGTSIIQVANQMVSGNQSISRNFTITSLDKQFSVPENNNGFDPVKRRGSKSLPASPLTTPITSPNSSPKLRKKLQNRYFTGVFTDKSVEGKDLYHGSWILSGLLGQRDIINKSNTAIAEEDYERGTIISENKKWQEVEVNNINMDEHETPVLNEKSKSPQLFRPKPSELREMNFWSPTSM